MKFSFGWLFNFPSEYNITEKNSSAWNILTDLDDVLPRSASVTPTGLTLFYLPPNVVKIKVHHSLFVGVGGNPVNFTVPTWLSLVHDTLVWSLHFPFRSSPNPSCSPVSMPSPKITELLYKHKTSIHTADEMIRLNSHEWVEGGCKSWKLGNNWQSYAESFYMKIFFTIETTTSYARTPLVSVCKSVIGISDIAPSTSIYQKAGQWREFYIRLLFSTLAWILDSSASERKSSSRCTSTPLQVITSLMEFTLIIHEPWRQQREMHEICFPSYTPLDLWTHSHPTPAACPRMHLCKGVWECVGSVWGGCSSQLGHGDYRKVVGSVVCSGMATKKPSSAPVSERLDRSKCDLQAKIHPQQITTNTHMDTWHIETWINTHVD